MRRLSLALTLVTGTALVTTSMLVMTPRQGGAEAEIRERREAFNRAIADRDTAALAAIWTDDVDVVTSAGGRISGRDAYRERFASYFENRPGYTYRREPYRVRVHEPWGVATERGRWRARWTEPDGSVDVGGEYLIHWRHTDAGWRVHAEMFAVIHCRGGRYCNERP
jgi:uncharacterized protein (TIGR02246 family)